MCTYILLGVPVVIPPNSRFKAKELTNLAMEVVKNLSNF